MTRKFIIFVGLGLMLSCSPRQFKTPPQLIEQAKEKQKKEERLKKDWRAIAVFCFGIWGVWQLKK